MITLGGVTLPVESLGIASPQKVAWLSLPAVANIAQDWGPGQKTFSLSGRFFLAEGGLDTCFQLDAIKANRKPVLLRIDPNSWQVQCQDFRYTKAGGIVTFDLELVELVAPTEYVKTAPPAVAGVGISAEYLVFLRLKATAFWWRGISNHVSAWLTDAELEISNLGNYLADAVSLVGLPSSVLGQIRRSAVIVSDRMSSLIAEIESEFATEPRRYSEDEESRKQALLYARSVLIRMQLLAANCKLQTPTPSSSRRAILSHAWLTATTASTPPLSPGPTSPAPTRSWIQGISFPVKS